jgi:hypothetical protein
MSWSLSFNVTRNEEGQAVLTLGHEFGAPEGDYVVTGHVLAHDKDWGESLGLTTPVGYVASTLNNPRTRNVSRVPLVNTTGREAIGLDVESDDGTFARVLLAPESIQEVVDALLAKRDQSVS